MENFEPTNCPLCNQKPMISGIEQRLSRCLNCIELRMNVMYKTDDKIHELEVVNDRLKRDVTDASEKIGKFQAFMKAEVEGVSAASQGLGEDQNPYPDGELCVMWLNGHQTVETRRRVGQAIAVMRWADSSLLTIQELARGYGQHEIADKIGTIVEKLEPFQGG